MIFSWLNFKWRPAISEAMGHQLVMVKGHVQFCHEPGQAQEDIGIIFVDELDMGLDMLGIQFLNFASWPPNI